MDCSTPLHSQFKFGMERNGVCECSWVDGSGGFCQRDGSLKGLDSSSASHSKYETNGREDWDLIEIVNDLQNKLSASGLSLSVSLPQIVVVGSQSAGKSSVLENIVGREFLPRGVGVVTRRPTIIQLYPSNEEYAIFLNKPEKKYVNFNEVRDEISRQTEETLGNQEFSSDPINIQIYSPNVLKLTLVDLPGLTKNPVGAQTQSVIDEVQDMVESYIQQPNSLILAISPANQDIANSHSLSIAKKFDPTSERTIGVLTKLDIMDKGTDAKDILENKVLHLRHGYVGVINRSQQDIAEKKDVSYILEQEKKFFENHYAYRHIAHHMGTPYLQQLLNSELRSHILRCLPEVRNELYKKLSACKKDLKELNGRIGDGKVKEMVIRLVQKFIDRLRVKLVGQSELVDLKNISAGSYINYLVRTELQEYLDLVLVPSDDELVTAMANVDGFRNGVSVPSLAFDALCHDLIQKYQDPMEKAVEAVSKVIVAVSEECALDVILYPSLKNELLYRVISYIKDQEESTKDILKNHIEAEMYHVNLGHPDFKSAVFDGIVPTVGPVRVWEKKSKDTESGSENDNENDTMNSAMGNSCNTSFSSNAPETLLGKLKANKDIRSRVTYLSAMIKKYVEIVNKTMSDIAIKYIMYFLVKEVLEFTTFELTAQIVTSANVDKLLHECQREVIKKEDLENMCQVIGSAISAIHWF